MEHMLHVKHTVFQQFFYFTKMDLKEMGWEGVDSVVLDQDGDK